MAPRISRRGQRRPSSFPWQAATAGSSAPPLPWRPCCCSPCLDEEQPCPPCSALLVFHPAGVLLLAWHRISPSELPSLLHGSSSSFLMALPPCPWLMPCSGDESRAPYAASPASFHSPCFSASSHGHGVQSPCDRRPSPPLCSALPVRRQQIYAAMLVHSSETHRSTRPWLPSFPSTSAPSSASRQSMQRATTSVSY
jgi:hypothetical protein